jgi:hypothetical protein
VSNRRNVELQLGVQLIYIKLIQLHWLVVTANTLNKGDPNSKLQLNYGHLKFWQWSSLHTRYNGYAPTIRAFFNKANKQDVMILQS